MKTPIPFNLTERSIQSLLRGYQEFGYKSLTRDDILAALNKIEKGEDFSTDIIAMFIERELREAGLLKEP